MTDSFADTSDPAATDEVHRLIGQFVVWFSAYTSVLIYGISDLAAGSPFQNRILWSLTQSMSESELRNQFFSATALFREPTGPEVQIRARLKTRAEDLSRMRNFIAHGYWSLRTESDQGTSFEPSLYRTRAKKEGPDHTPVLTSREELRRLVAQAEELFLLFSEYSERLRSEQYPSLAGKFASVTEALGFVNGELVRLDLTNWSPAQ